jgi:hypothetical protein
VVDDQHKHVYKLVCLDIIYYRCIRFNTNQERNPVRDPIKNGAKDLECAKKWRTGLSGAPDRIADKLATLGKSRGALRYNSPDCPVRQRSNA